CDAPARRLGWMYLFVHTQPHGALGIVEFGNSSSRAPRWLRVTCAARPVSLLSAPGLVEMPVRARRRWYGPAVVGGCARVPFLLSADAGPGGGVAGWRPSQRRRLLFGVLMSSVAG